MYTLASGPFDTVSGSIVLTEADVADLRAGNLYVNIHSVANPAGFARGQLRLPAAPVPVTPVSLPRTGSGGMAGSDTHATWLLALLSVGLLTTALAVRARQRP